MSQKKKVVKKIQAKKLEDRIAPGMVGGGLVDPGMVDTVESDSTQEAPKDSTTTYQTESDSLSGNYSQSTSGGQYLDDTSSTSTSTDASAGTTQEYTSPESQHISGGEQLDEFASPSASDAPLAENHQTWNEMDWVNTHADGSMEFNLPEGVSVDAAAGVANFPLQVANNELPLPEGSQLNAEGGLDLKVPSESQYLADSHQLLVPQDFAPQIPTEMEHYQAPDNMLMVNLPPDGASFDANTQQINFDNYWANELTPANMEVQENGDVQLHFPADGVSFNGDHSVALDPDAAHLMEHPPENFYQNFESDHSQHVEINGDGSITFMPPEGIQVEGGVMEMNASLANEYLPVPQEFHFNPDGSAHYQLNDQVQFSEQANALIFPQNEINLNVLPEEVQGHLNPDGTTTVLLENGMNYNPEHHHVELDNYWANEVLPTSMNFTPDGQVQVILPEGTQFYENNAFTIPADETGAFTQEVPAYVHEVPWVNVDTTQGGFECTPPPGTMLYPEQGTLQIPNEMISQHLPVDPDVRFEADGTMNVNVPQGTVYHADSNTLTFPGSQVQLHEVPPQVNPQVDANGNITIQLQDGMQFNPATQSVHFDNYWTNELTPPSVEITDQGTLQIHLPPHTEYHPDGHFSVPEHQADFMHNPAPEYIQSGPDWVIPNNDGSVTLMANEHMQVNPENHSIQMSVDYVNEHFADSIPEEVTLNADGTMNVQVPQGTLYDVGSQVLTFPAGQVHLNEIPQNFEATLNDNGSISLHLQSGMEYNPGNGSVHFDQHWTHELMPPAIEMTPEGQMIVDMPHDAHFYPNGHVFIPESSIDFIESPHAEIVNQGPDWIHHQPDGSLAVHVPEGMNVNPEAGTLTMSHEVAQEEFGRNIMHDEFQFLPNGSMEMKIPDDIKFEYNAAQNSFTLTEVPHDFNPHDAPPFLTITPLADGNFSVQLPEGVQYNQDHGSLILSNQMVNEILPPPVEYSPNGQLSIHLPPDTQYFPEQGQFILQADSAHFLDENYKGDENYNSPSNATGTTGTSSV